MKRLLSILLASAMLFSLTACSSESESSQTTETETSTDSTFVIGGMGPLTGAAAAYGISVKQGAEIAIEEINAAGGVVVGDTTYTLELNFADDEASEETAITAYNTLMDDGINVLMGTVTSGAGLAIISQSYQDGILQLTPSGSAIGLTEYDNSFRLCFTDPLQGQMMAEYIVSDLGLTNVAVIYNNADEYSSGMKDAFVEKVGELGGTVVAQEAFNTGDVDFSTQLTTIKGTNAQAIFVPAYYGDASYITQQASDNGIELPFFGGDGWDGILSQVTDASTVEGAVFLSPFLATDPNVADFVSTYETKYSATPDQFAADGYDCVYVFKAAMEQAGSIESADLISAMTEISISGLTGDISFSANGEPTKGAKFIEIVDGEYTSKQ